MSLNLIPEFAISELLPAMKIVIYCQYVWGMGHLVRSLEFARALSEHDVTLIIGGREVDVDLPRHVRIVRLPVMYMDEKFTRLIADTYDQNIEKIKWTRRNLLLSVFAEKQPDFLIVELYPFGRSFFGFELEPLLEDIRNGKFGDTKTICSLRDILVKKKDPAAYEERVLRKLNRYFDALLIHSDRNLVRLDETFSRVGDIEIPVEYTGFVTQQVDPDAGKKLRQELQVAAGEKLVVASAGGGRSGYKLLKCVVDACTTLTKWAAIRLEVFSGPFMENEEFEMLCARSSLPGFRIRRYTRRFMAYLYAADLSVSLAGYNTCMNLLATGVPALVYPYSRQQEQPMRAEKLKDFLPMKILNDDDLQPDRLSRHMYDMLQNKRSPKAPPIDMNGAASATEILKRWIEESTI